MSSRNKKRSRALCKFPSVEEPGKRCGHRIPCPYHGIGIVCDGVHDTCDAIDNHLLAEEIRIGRRVSHG